MLLSQAAPAAAFVFGTLPSGSAYPADPAAEMARLAAMESELKRKADVQKCLRFIPGPTPPAASAEEVARAAVLGAPLPGEGGGGGPAPRARNGSPGGGAGGATPREAEGAGGRGLNRTANDVWILDRGATFEALPLGLRLEGGAKETAAFRRLHPAMVRNKRRDGEREGGGGGGGKGAGRTLGRPRHKKRYWAQLRQLNS